MERNYTLNKEDSVTIDNHVLYRVIYNDGRKGGYIEKEENLFGNTYIGPDARIYDKAHVSGNAVIDGKTYIYGNAIVSGNADISGQYYIDGGTVIQGNAIIKGTGIISGNILINSNVIINGNGILIKGTVYISMNAKINGYATIQGMKIMITDNASVKGIIRDCAFIGGDAIVNELVSIQGPARIIGNAIIERDEDYIVFKNWWSSGRYFTWTRSNDKYTVGCFYGTGKELVKRAYQKSKNTGKGYKRIVKYVNSIKRKTL